MRSADRYSFWRKLSLLRLILLPATFSFRSSALINQPRRKGNEQPAEPQPDRLNRLAWKGSDVDRWIIAIAIHSLPIINRGQIALQLSLEGEINGPIQLMKLLIDNHMVMPLVQQLRVLCESQNQPRQKIDNDDEAYHQTQEFPALVKDKIEQQKGWSQLDRNRQSHKNGGLPIVMLQAIKQRSKQQIGSKKMSIAIMQDDNKILQQAAGEHDPSDI